MVWIRLVTLVICGSQRKFSFFSQQKQYIFREKKTNYNLSYKKHSGSGFANTIQPDFTGAANTNNNGSSTGDLLNIGNNGTGAQQDTNNTQSSFADVRLSFLFYHSEESKYKLTFFFIFVCSHSVSKLAETRLDSLVHH